MFYSYWFSAQRDSILRTFKWQVATATLLGASLVAETSMAQPPAAGPEDLLSRGQIELRLGDLEKAHPLLLAASEARPDSVDAQLALAECQLKLGKLSDALASFRRVLKLSPQHRYASAVVKSLTSGTSSRETTLAATRTLMDLGRFGDASSLIKHLQLSPQSGEQRLEVELLEAENELWRQASSRTVQISLLLTERTTKPEDRGAARVMAALAILNNYGALTDSDKQLAQSLLAEADGAAGQWKARKDLATLLLKPGAPAEFAGKLDAAFAAIPASPFRHNVLQRIVPELVTQARRQFALGNTDEALNIVWPLAFRGALPDNIQERALQPSGLLKGADQQQQLIANVLVEIGQQEVLTEGHEANLRAFWFASRIYAGNDSDKSSDSMLVLAAVLARYSQHQVSTRGEHVSGQDLSPVDSLQRELLFGVAERPLTSAQRSKLISYISEYIARYKKHGDAETALEQFIAVAGQAAELKVGLTPKLQAIQVDSNKQALLTLLTQISAEIGAQQFEKSARSLSVPANQDVQKFDRVAILLASRCRQLFPQDKTATKVALAIIERYAARQQWELAETAASLFYAGLPEPVRRWQTVQLAIRMTSSREAKLQSANRYLGQELSAELKAALEAGAKIVAEHPADVAKEQFIIIVQPLVNRYMALDRRDLAQQVIALAAPDKSKMTDWGIWTRAVMIDSLVSRRLAALPTAAQQPLPMLDEHVEQLGLIDELIKQHQDSRYASLAIEKVFAIAETYPRHKAHDVGLKVLRDFATAHPQLRSLERIEYAVCGVLLKKAHDAFQESIADGDTPDSLSAEYAAAIDALAQFIKDHPTGDYVQGAEQQLFQVAVVYGNVDAWPVTRAVLTRFAKAVPDFAQPRRLQYFTAITHLGELDRGYGLGKLQLRVVARTTTATGLASAANGASGDDEEAGANDAAPTPDAVASIPAIDPFGASGPGVDDAFGAAPAPGGGAGGGFGGFSNQGGAQSFSRRPNRPSQSSLAMIRQSQQRQFSQLAMLEREGNLAANLEPAQELQAEAQQAIALPNGKLLSDAEMKRREAAADEAYELLLTLMQEAQKDQDPHELLARNEIMWLFGFFEGQQRPDHTVTLIRRYLTDNPDDQERVALSYQVINDQLAWATQRQNDDRPTLAWLDQRHKLFEEARASADAFLKEFAEEASWSQRAQLLKITSYERESALARRVSSVRAGGLLVQSSEAILRLLNMRPVHPQAGQFPQRLWNTAEQLQGLGQQDAAIYVLSQLPIHFPTHAHAKQSVLRIAQLYAANLNNPLRAVETYQEYLHLNGDDEAVRTQIFSIAQQLTQNRRYLESLHVFGVFVDSFPSDKRAAQALRAIGKTHQDNEAWSEAIAAYQRILDEFPAAAEAPAVKLDVAECQINLSGWREARSLYEEFAQQYPKDGNAAVAKARIPILKILDRYQTLLEDAVVQRNKDDAQMQIARIVLQQLNNPIKAVAEFRRVVSNFPESDLADDAQLEVGKALLRLHRVDEAREALLVIPVKYENSPLADDALFLVGGSYEQQAQELATVTTKDAWARALVRNQRAAYWSFNDQLQAEKMRQATRRSQLKQAGQKMALDLDEGANINREQNLVFGNLFNLNKKAEIQAEAESALQVANRQDRINEAFREAVRLYERAATEYPLGDQTDDSLLRIAQILESRLKDNDAAMATYQKIVKLFPGTPVAEDAAWKVASFYADDAQYTSAANAYRTFIRNYPASQRVADAQFALAEVLEELGKWGEAMDAYETFRQKFAKHPKALVASEQINWIKTYRK